MRPSYVLGGQNMIIAFSEQDIQRIYGDHPGTSTLKTRCLIDKYLMGIEIEVDAICDGEDILIPGIMQHVERAGIHSGDSIAVYPAWHVGRYDDQTASWNARKRLAVAHENAWALSTFNM